VIVRKEETIGGLGPSDAARARHEFTLEVVGTDPYGTMETRPHQLVSGRFGGESDLT